MHLLPNIIALLNLNFIIIIVIIKLKRPIIIVMLPPMFEMLYINLIIIERINWHFIVLIITLSHLLII